MATTAPERTLQLIHSHRRKFDNIEQFYAFRNAALNTITDTNPKLILNYLKSLKRGGNQQNSSRWFSDYWASQDPEAAADHFFDLIKLRNS